MHPSQVLKKMAEEGQLEELRIPDKPGDAALHTVCVGLPSWETRG